MLPDFKKMFGIFGEIFVRLKPACCQIGKFRLVVKKRKSNGVLLFDEGFSQFSVT
jgi:hypothetical protein